ncbi:hypothetical protein SLEP1_g56989 [Rubroshorea leprosula]|uniref:Transposase n=1 Tax=Rubroshorea leprosula TaxID=152421 RepID=A0AAV5MNF2_9ROSI|nr:hypothetical protein SLEP1_g56989 [Rubroshorea leprosula]
MSDDDATFKICIHYAGHVTRDVSRYVGGETCDLGVNDIDKLCYFDIIDKLNEVEIQSVRALYYKVPDLPFASGLMPLNGDVEIIEVAKILMELAICHVYVQHDSSNMQGEIGVQTSTRPFFYKVNIDAGEGSSRTHLRHGKMALFLHDMLGSDVDDDELVAGIEKMNHRYADFETFNCAASEGPRFVANSNLENSDSDFSDRDSEYVDSSDPGSYYSDSSIEDLDSFVKDDALRTASSHLHYDPNCEVPHFEVGMVFKNAIQFKEAIAKYSVKKGCNLHWKKNEPGRQRYACDVKNGCPWEIYAGFDSADNCFKIKTYYRKHACFKTNKNRLVTRPFLANALRTLVTNAPHLTGRQLAKHVKSEMEVDVSIYKCQRAKKIIKDELHGSYIEQYKLLRGYGEHMLSTNPKSTCVIAREAIFPYAKHKYCARHVYANWAKIWRGEEFKIRFWAIAQASWPKEYEHQMMLLKKLSEATWTDLQRYDPKKWCRAFFDEEPYCDMVDNNMCESFNFWVMEARYLAIISMVDTLRSQVMERIGEKYAFIPKWKGDIAPRARKKLEANKKKSSSWKLVWDGRTGFEKEKYALAYGFPIKGMCEDKSWQKFHGEPLNPPPIRKRPERPKKNRRKPKDEPKKVSKAVILSRKGRVMTCSNCKQGGHNKSSCPFKLNDQMPPAIASTNGSKRRPSATYHRKPKAVKTNVNVNPSQASNAPSCLTSLAENTIVSREQPQSSFANKKGKEKTGLYTNVTVREAVNEHIAQSNSGGPTAPTVVMDGPSTEKRNIFVMPPTGDNMSLATEDNFWAAI